MTARLSYVTAGAAILTFAVYLGIATARNGGVFEYPLDDVYIHLAMAEQLFAGGYGVNADEYSSASSSPVYPLFLPTWAGLEVQRWLPLLWNVLALTLAAWLLGLALSNAALGRAGYLIGAIAPVALSMHVTAFTGMENMAHTAASLAIVLGLWRFAESGRIGPLLVLGILLAPACRIEGLALALAAAGAVFLLGRYLAGIGLGVLALLPVLAFSGWLMSLGLDPLPNSVNAKLRIGDGMDVGVAGELIANIRLNLALEGGVFLFALAVPVLLLALVALGRGAKGEALVALAVVAAALAHLGFGTVGFLNRYENYMILSLFAVLTLLVSREAETTKRMLLALALLGGILAYGPTMDNYLNNPRAIYLQQAQMSRFAKDYVKAPVAVNDLGYISWNNPDHVLDLWGLASAKALEIRKSGPAPGWADALADEKGVRVAITYPEWLPDAFGPDWVLLGGLFLLDHGQPFLGGQAVLFRARNQAEANALRPELRDWAAGLPEGATFDFAPETGDGS